METRRGEVKSWDKEAGARLPGASSGLAAASGFLGVHREPPGPPLGLSGWGEGPKGQSTQSSQETSRSAAPRHYCRGCWWKALDATGALITILHLCFRRPG